MGMGAIPCHGQTTTLGKLRKLMPTELAECEKVLATIMDENTEEPMNWNSVCLMVDYQQNLPPLVDDAIKLLQEQFQVATGLTLSFGMYHNEDGDRYDDLEDGPLFFVGGVYVQSEAAIANKDLWEDVSWTVYG